MMDGPHADVWRHQALEHPTQALRSTHILAFQIPWLPDAVLTAFGFSALRTLMRSSAHKDMFEPGALDR
ncbi:hypothetical protein FHS96_005636 [Sphingomonas zeicaulis]